jgi:uncharacterized protein YbaR (Trm112 family)
MIAKELLDILCCPETKQDLELADEATVKKINQAIESGELKNRAGDTVKDKIDGGLIRQDKKYIYAVRDDIPIMLIDEAIPFETFVS